MHRHSVVVDSYGFGPMGAPGMGVEMLLKQIDAGASETELRDLREDISMTGCLDDAIRAIVDGGGLAGICAVPAILGQTGDINAMLDHIDYMTKTFGVDSVAIGR